MNLILPTLTREEAAIQGYAAITVVFDPSAEPAVVRSMESGMQGKDAVWIVRKDQYRTVVQLGRRVTEINLKTPESVHLKDWTKPSKCAG